MRKVLVLTGVAGLLMLAAGGKEDAGSSDPAAAKAVGLDTFSADTPYLLADDKHEPSSENIK
ncbi:MAG: hypothetical protein V7637_1927 [Mycobacteriales bacterium]